VKNKNIKRTLSVTATAFALAACASFQAAAQTVQYVTLTYTAASGNPNYSLQTNYYAVQTNQVVSLVGITGGVCNYYSASGTAFSDSTVGHIYTGLTNVALMTQYNSGSSAETFQITTPPTAAIVTNYVPADAVVIPASASGNVQIILESSPDLVNWTAAQPGIYGPSAATNRFFRVRAVAN
jgi:hypothetical protein